MKNCLLLSLLTTSLVAALPAQEMPKPAPEHQKLAATVGTWDAVIEMAGEDGKPTTSKGVSEVRMLGGFWLIDDFTADFDGMPFQGHGMTGWDAAKGKYVGTWADSWSPYMMQMEGTTDKDGKVSTMTGMAPGPDGKLAQHRLVTTWKDANTRVFEMHVTGADGKEMKVMTITYTRRAAKSPEPKNPGPGDRVR